MPAEEVELLVGPGVVVDEDAVREVVGPQIEEAKGGLGVAGLGNEVRVLAGALSVEPPLPAGAVEHLPRDPQFGEHRFHRVRLAEILRDEHGVQPVGVEPVFAGVLDVGPETLVLAYRGHDEADVAAFRCHRLSRNSLGNPKMSVDLGRPKGRCCGGDRGNPTGIVCTAGSTQRAPEGRAAGGFLADIRIRARESQTTVPRPTETNTTAAREGGAWTWRSSARR